MPRKIDINMIANRDTYNFFWGRRGSEFSRSPLIPLLVAAIIFGAPMVAGYAVLDELAIYTILVSMVAAHLLRAGGNCSPMEMLHRALFTVFATYLVLQSIRGMFVLGDIRILRFISLFTVLAVIVWYVPVPTGDQASLLALSRAVASAGTTYFILYLLVGVAAENYFDKWRFDLQGSMWSGTAVAIFPSYLMFAPLSYLALNRDSKNQRLFWISYVVLVLVCAYYDSRAMKIGLLLLLVFGCFKVGAKRLIILGVVYLFFLVYFPWTTEERLTSHNLQRYIATLPTSLSREALFQRSWNFGESLLPGLLPAIRREINTGFGESVTALSHTAYRSYDFDRKLAIVAAIRYLTDGGGGRFLFGSGYYTHRVTLVPVFQQVAYENNYRLPDSYSTIVRTATFNGMLADTGLVGIFLLGALGVMSATTIFTSKSDRKLLSFASLGMVALSTVTSAQYDLVLFYMAFLPGGPILAYHSLHSIPSQFAGSARIDQQCQR